LNRDVERHSWPLTFPPSTVNAFYLYSRNLVILILQLETDFMIFFAFDKFWINVVKLWKEHNPYRTSLGGCYLKTSPNWWSFRVGISESISSLNGEDWERRPSKQIIQPKIKWSKICQTFYHPSFNYYITKNKTEI
jgi:hypothetical protein